MLWNSLRVKSRIHHETSLSSSIYRCWAWVFLLFIHSQGTVDSKETSHFVLYKGEGVSVYAHIFNGEASVLQFSATDESEPIYVELHKFEHYILNNDVPLLPISERGYEIGKLNLSAGKGHVAVKYYSLDDKLKSLVESFDILLKVNGELVHITENFQLKKISYSYFDALMGV